MTATVRLPPFLSFPPSRCSPFFSCAVPAKVDTVYLALAILYFVAAGLEAFGFYAAFKSSIRFVRAYFWCSATVALIVVAAEMTRTVVCSLPPFFPTERDADGRLSQIHFVDKDEIKMACADSYADDISSGLVTAGTVSDYCASNWTSGTYVRFPTLARIEVEEY